MEGIGGLSPEFCALMLQSLADQWMAQGAPGAQGAQPILAGAPGAPMDPTMLQNLVGALPMNPFLTEFVNLGQLAAQLRGTPAPMDNLQMPPLPGILTGTSELAGQWGSLALGAPTPAPGSSSSSVLANIQDHLAPDVLLAGAPGAPNSPSPLNQGILLHQAPTTPAIHRFGAPTSAQWNPPAFPFPTIAAPDARALRMLFQPESPSGDSGDSSSDQLDVEAPTMLFDALGAPAQLAPGAPNSPTSLDQAILLHQAPTSPAMLRVGAPIHDQGILSALLAAPDARDFSMLFQPKCPSGDSSDELDVKDPSPDAPTTPSMLFRAPLSPTMLRDALGAQALNSSTSSSQHSLTPNPAPAQSQIPLNLVLAPVSSRSVSPSPSPSPSPPAPAALIGIAPALQVPKISPLEFLRAVLKIGKRKISTTPLTRIPKNPYIFFLAIVKEGKDRGLVSENLDARLLWHRLLPPVRDGWKKIFQKTVQYLEKEVAEGRKVRAAPRKNKKF